MPHSRSAGRSGATASSAPETSPSGISRTRPPAARIASMPSLWRGRSSTTTITSRTSVPLRSATSWIVSPSGRSRSSRSARCSPAAIFSMYTHGPGSNIEPRSDSAITASALGRPSAASRVPSSGSTAMSTSGPSPAPTCSPLWSIGASSFSPSPMTTMPFMDTVGRTACMPSTAAWSAASLSPWPTSRAADRAAASVTRTSSSARLRSTGVLIYMTPGGLRTRSVWPAAIPPPTIIRTLPRKASQNPQSRPIAPLGEPGRSSSPV